MTSAIEVDQSYREDATFPKPEVELAAGRVWKWEEVEAWASTTGRLK
jgi:hypothetical protein